MRFRPILDRVLLKDEEASLKEGPIFLPEQRKKFVLRGVVVAVGSGSRSESGRIVPPQVAVGDLVTYAPYAATPVQLDDGPYWVVRERDIGAIIRSEVP